MTDEQHINLIARNIVQQGLPPLPTETFQWEYERAEVTAARKGIPFTTQWHGQHIAASQAVQLAHTIGANPTEFAAHVIRNEICEYARVD